MKVGEKIYSAGAGMAGEQPAGEENAETPAPEGEATQDVDAKQKAEGKNVK